MESLGRKISELRKNANVTQDGLAEALEVTRQTISQWEQDIVIPKSDKLKALCEYFNVKPDYFLFDNAKAEPLVKPEEITVIQALPLDNAESFSVIDAEALINEEALTKESPKKKSKKKTVIITCAVIISVIAAAIMLFIAWLKAPTKGVAVSVSSSSWRFDIVTVLQIIAGIILFVVACIVVAAIIKCIKNRKK